MLLNHKLYDCFTAESYMLGFTRTRCLFAFSSNCCSKLSSVIPLRFFVSSLPSPHMKRDVQQVRMRVSLHYT